MWVVCLFQGDLVCEFLQEVNMKHVNTHTPSVKTNTPGVETTAAASLPSPSVFIRLPRRPGSSPVAGQMVGVPAGDRMVVRRDVVEEDRTVNKGSFIIG